MCSVAVQVESTIDLSLSLSLCVCVCVCGSLRQARLQMNWGTALRRECRVLKKKKKRVLGKIKRTFLEVAELRWGSCGLATWTRSPCVHVLTYERMSQQLIRIHSNEHGTSILSDTDGTSLGKTLPTTTNHKFAGTANTRCTRPSIRGAPDHPYAASYWTRTETLEHLQEFIKFYLANLVICQLPKLYAK